MVYQVEKSDQEWKQQLSREEYDVLRKAATERAFTGEYNDTETIGIYRCKACNAKLFESDTKFHSGCGWPSFYQPITRHDRVHRGQQPRDAADRGPVRQLRLPPRSRLPRRSRHPDR